jgi:hypothetical protein
MEYMYGLVSTASACRVAPEQRRGKTANVSLPASAVVIMLRFLGG